MLLVWCGHQTLDDAYGGWLDPKSIDSFARYAEVSQTDKQAVSNLEQAVAA